MYWGVLPRNPQHSEEIPLTAEIVNNIARYITSYPNLKKNSLHQDFETVLLNGMKERPPWTSHSMLSTFLKTGDAATGGLYALLTHMGGRMSHIKLHDCKGYCECEHQIEHVLHPSHQSTNLC